MNRKTIILGILMTALCLTMIQPGICQTRSEDGPNLTNDVKLTLKENTLVRLRLESTISSATARTNDKVYFEVLEDVKVGDTVVIARGSRANAVITEARSKKSLGRGGKLRVRIEYVSAINGETVALRAEQGARGDTHTAAMTATIVASSLLFFPVAPLFLFINGKNITIPQDTLVTAYVAVDTPILAARKDAAIAVNVVAMPQTTTVDSTRVDVRSLPLGAEIKVDGKFVGTTPSTLVLPAGEHAITIGKNGFMDWSRQVSLTAGSSISIDATLEGDMH